MARVGTRSPGRGRQIPGFYGGKPHGVIFFGNPTPKEAYQLARVYGELNGKPTPRHYRYLKPQHAVDELWTEAIRAYLTNPNYLKTVAPDVAKRIRREFNTHPTLSKTIQFNAIVPPALIGTGALGTGIAGEDDAGQPSRGRDFYEAFAGKQGS